MWIWTCESDTNTFEFKFYEEHSYEASRRSMAQHIIGSLLDGTPACSSEHSPPKDNGRPCKDSPNCSVPYIRAVTRYRPVGGLF